MPNTAKWLTVFIWAIIMFELGMIFAAHVYDVPPTEKFTITMTHPNCAPIETLPGITQPWHTPYVCK